jgi:hypothetical protein
VAPRAPAIAIPFRSPRSFRFPTGSGRRASFYGQPPQSVRATVVNGRPKRNATESAETQPKDHTTLGAIRQIR